MFKGSGCHSVTSADAKEPLKAEEQSYFPSTYTNNAKLCLLLGMIKDKITLPYTTIGPCNIMKLNHSSNTRPASV